MKNILTILLLCCCTFVFAQGKGAATGSARIIIQPSFNNQQLNLETKQYVNAHGDSLYIDEFRFYISGIKFSGTEHPFIDKATCHLVDAAENATRSIVIKGIPAGEYATLNLMIGVDSMANVSGANTGDLDPVKGMYWAWNTGYIMAKLQGRSSACKTLHHAYEFHIGGYLSPYNAVRKVSLQLPKFVIKPGKETRLYIKADAAEWFRHPEMVDLAKMNEVNMPGKNAMMIANNYIDMFSVLRVE